MSSVCCPLLTERKPGVQIRKTLSKAVTLRTTTYAREGPSLTARPHPRHTHTGLAPGLTGGVNCVTQEAGGRGQAGAVPTTGFKKVGALEKSAQMGVSRDTHAHARVSVSSVTQKLRKDFTTLLKSESLFLNSVQRESHKTTRNTAQSLHKL